MDWEQTRVLAGEVGDFAVIARKDRHSEDWYLGAITDEHGRKLRVPLDFLGGGMAWRAEIHRDGDAAHFERNPHDFVRETREVKAGESMELRLAAGGGVAIRFTPIARTTAL